MQPFYAPGIYRCQVSSQAMGESGTGKPQFVLRFMVLATANGESVKQYERSHYRTITDKTAQYFAQDLRALGYQHQTFKLLDPSTPGFHDFAGQQVEMVCNHEPDQKGELRERWGVVSSGAAVKPLSQQKLRELDNLFGKHLKSAPAASSAAPTAPVNASPFEITDDDIPF